MGPAGPGHWAQRAGAAEDVGGRAARPRRDPAVDRRDGAAERRRQRRPDGQLCGRRAARAGRDAGLSQHHRPVGRAGLPDPAAAGPAGRIRPHEGQRRAGRLGQAHRHRLYRRGEHGAGRGSCGAPAGAGDRGRGQGLRGLQAGAVCWRTDRCRRCRRAGSRGAQSAGRGIAAGEAGVGRRVAGGDPARHGAAHHCPQLRRLPCRTGQARGAERPGRSQAGAGGRQAERHIRRHRRRGDLDAGAERRSGLGGAGLRPDQRQMAVGGAGPAAACRRGAEDHCRTGRGGRVAHRGRIPEGQRGWRRGRQGHCQAVGGAEVQGRAGCQRLRAGDGRDRQHRRAHGPAGGGGLAEGTGQAERRRAGRAACQPGGSGAHRHHQRPAAGAGQRTDSRRQLRPAWGQRGAGAGPDQRWRAGRDRLRRPGGRGRRVCRRQRGAVGARHRDGVRRCDPQGRQPGSHRRAGKAAQGAGRRGQDQRRGRAAHAGRAGQAARDHRRPAAGHPEPGRGAAAAGGEAAGRAQGLGGRRPAGFR